MIIKEGATVLASGGEEIGSVDLVVLDPDTNDITHVVVKKGMFFTEQKVIPISNVGTATEDKLTLWASVDEWDNLQDFEESQYIAAEVTRPQTPGARPEPRPVFPKPTIAVTQSVSARGVQAMPRYVQRVVQNIPEGTVALDAGAKVIAKDGEYVGDIERISVDSKTEQATHLLLSAGIFTKQKREIPVTWVNTVVDNEVRLSVHSDQVEQLPEYKPQN